MSTATAEVLPTELVVEELSANDVVIMRAAERYGRAQMTALGELAKAPSLLALAVLAPAAAPSDIAAPRRRTEWCMNNCNEEVAGHYALCAACAPIVAQRRRGFALEKAYKSICPPDPELCPEGALVWCRPGLDEYVATTEKARNQIQYLPLDERKDAVEIVVGARWKRTHGSLVILGETGIGKSTILAAIGLRLLDLAFAGALPEDAFRFARRVRWINGIDLGVARAEHALGAGEPKLIMEAKRASLLLLDEIGYENDRYDPHAVRDVLYARSIANMPTIVTSGKTAAELESVYKGALMRRLWEPGRGRVLDLHPRSSR